MYVRTYIHANRAVWKTMVRMSLVHIPALSNRLEERGDITGRQYFIVLVKAGRHGPKGPSPR